MFDSDTDHLSVLLIESSADSAATFLTSALEENLHITVTRIQGMGKGIVVLEEQEFDAVVFHFDLNDSTALHSISLLEATHRCCLIAATSSPYSSKQRKEIFAAGADEFALTQGINASSLRRMIESAHRQFALKGELRIAKAESDDREQLLRRVYDANSEAMLVLSKTHEIRSYNITAARLLDAPIGGMIGEIFPFAIDQSVETELEIPEANGETKLIGISVVDIKFEGNASKLVVLKDISRARATEQELENLKGHLSATLSGMTEAVIISNEKGTVEQLNQVASKITGFEENEVIGQPLGKILKLRHPESGKRIKDPRTDLLRPEFLDAYNVEGIPLERKDGGAEARVRASMHTITDKEGENCGNVTIFTESGSISDELIEGDPSTSINVLAGGIAHDFNNLLAAILGNISVARVKIDQESDLAQKLLSAEQAAMQARSLSQQLLTFSKGGDPLIEVTTVDDLVRESALFVLRGSNVKCEIESEKELWAIEADKGQLNQVISNLTINADQAMPDGGIIDIKLKNVQIQRGEIPSLDKGSYVEITFADNGIGIQKRHLKRIFDPYFSTKEEGNGLGLASSQSVIKRHGGAITVDSTIGEGSTFRVYLPRSESSQALVGTKTTEESRSQDEPKLGQASGRILVMDDMEAMMMVAGEILTVLGYDVSYSTNGQEAIDAYKAAKEEGNPFDAVVFDLTVPGGMGGEEASNILIEYDPDLIAIASSGYTTSNVMSDYQNSAFKAVVPKPYRIKEMSDALNRVLKK